MNESDIKAVAEALSQWSPLREYANTISDLEGYRTEAIDVISTLSFSAGKLSATAAINRVLSQAFELPLDEAAVQGAAKEIDMILGVKH